MLQEFAFETGCFLSSQESSASKNKNLNAALSDFFEVKLTKDMVSPEQLEVLLRTSSVEELASKLKKGEAPKNSKTYAELQTEFKKMFSIELELKKLREDFSSLKSSYRKKEGNFDVQLQALAAKELGPLILEKGTLFTFFAPENKKVKVKEPSYLHYPGFFDWGREVLLPVVQSAIQETLPSLLTVWKPIQKKILAEAGALGPDELLQTMQAALTKDAFRQKVQKKYRAVLIDEFQDTDPIQWNIFQTLFLGSAEAFYLIGDPKQSIYRFRKADLYTYLSAKDAIEPHRHFYLDTNFRSSKALVDVLNRLFDREWLYLPKQKRSLPFLPVRAGANITSTLSDGKGAVHCVIFEKDEQFSYVAAEISSMKKEVNAWSSFAILVKDRFQVAKMQEILSSLGIPSMAKSHEPLAESFAFEVIKELFEALDDVRNLSKTKVVQAGPFGQLDLFSLRKCLEEEGLAKMCARLPNLSSELTQVFELLFEWERKSGFSFDGIARFFESCRNMDPEDAPCLWENNETDAVQIMTMHGSKGLEFEIVFAWGLGMRTPPCDEESEAEKLRQLYVAMTRAKRRLYIPIPVGAKEVGEGRHSPIELFCRAFDSTTELWEQELKAISAETDLTIERVVEPVLLPAKREDPKILTDEPMIPIPPFQPSYLLSFTALSQEKERAKEALEPIDAPNGIYTMHNLPRGAEVGVLIHSLFERLFSGDPFIELIPPSFLPWQGAICKMIEETLNLPLPMGFCLRDVDRRRTRVEVEFLFETPPNYLKGFIDLVFVYKETLYFVDWKTNWLGKSTEDYSSERIQAAMDDHQYHLQASIYSESLRRSWKGPVGGGIYIFVRGPKAICLWKN
jgi:exodeoxyribonuclease V beta subunit